MHNINQEAAEVAHDRIRKAGPECVADNAAARANRYQLSLHNQENAAPREVCLQLLEALNNSDKQFDMFLHDALKRRDEALIGKLTLRLLDLHRHFVAEAVSE